VGKGGGRDAQQHEIVKVIEKMATWFLTKNLTIITEKTVTNISSYQTKYQSLKTIGQIRQYGYSL
jgi:hypothetical protein